MTFKLVLTGLQSLRTVTPGLVFLTSALLLILMPRRWSAALGGPMAVATTFVIVLLHLVGPAPKLPERTDLVADRLTQSAGLWLAVVVPVIAAGAQRYPMQGRGLAIGCVLFSAGGLCFLAASGSVALFVVSLTLSMIGVAALPFGFASLETESQRPAVHVAFAVFGLWTILVVGMALILTAIPNGDLSPGVARGRPSGLTLAGLTLIGIAILGLFGAAPLSTWFWVGRAGARSAVVALLLSIGLITYLKFGRLLVQPDVVQVLWAWSVGSACVHVAVALRSATPTACALSAAGATASIAVACLFLGGRAGDATGPLVVLAALTLAVPGLGAALDSCEINSRGDLGKPSGLQSVSLRLALYMLPGLPFSFGFWGWILSADAGEAHGREGGMRQATAAVAAAGFVLVTFRFLRHWAWLQSRPPLQLVEEDRWSVVGSLGAAAVLFALGCWPGPILAVLQEIAANALSETPPGP